MPQAWSLRLAQAWPMRVNKLASKAPEQAGLNFHQPARNLRANLSHSFGGAHPVRSPEDPRF